MSFGPGVSALADFCRRNRLPDLSFDSKGLCHLLIDGSLPATLRNDTGSNRLSLIAQVQPSLPLQPGHRWLERCLQEALNPLFGERPGLGWHPELGLVAYLHLPLGEGSVPNLEEAFATLVDSVKQWREVNLH